MKLVFNSEWRIRAGWRVLLQFVLFFVVLIAAQLLQEPAVKNGNPVGYAAGSLVYLAGMVLVIFALSRWIDRRPISDFGLHFDSLWWQDLAAGLCIGAFTLTTVAVIELSLGWVELSPVQRNPFNIAVIPAALLALLNLIAVAFGEEITFRSYQVKNLAEGFRKIAGERAAVMVAFGISSVLFGLAHLMNPNVGWLSVLNVVLAGLLMGLGFILTGSLAIPLGFHIAWGFFEEYVFGYANSGQVPLNSLMTNTLTGPELWTGGKFGPEGGLLVLLLILVDMALVFLWIKGRKRWQGIHTELAVYRNREGEASV